jgi:hypothetical protein
MTENPLSGIWRDMARIRMAIMSGLLFVSEKERLEIIAAKLSDLNAAALTDDQAQALKEGSGIASGVWDPNQISVRYTEKVYPERPKTRIH